jgi:hypothetical protein
MKFAWFFLLLLLLGCSFPEEKVGHESGLMITEIKPNRDSAIMKQNVLHLAQVYDLSPFLFTKIIQIKTDAIPQSHPVLTLNIKYTKYPNKILASLLHEEFHWWAVMNKVGLTQSLNELSKILPGKPQADYIHLFVCYLEFEAVKYYLGEKTAREIFQDFIRKDQLRPWLYSQVLVHDKLLKKIFSKNKLIPTPLF